MGSNPTRYTGWPGHYNNVGCSARLEISFELNLLPSVNKVTLLLFFVLHETVSSYTLTSLIDNEKHESLRDAIIVLCAEVRSLGDRSVNIRVDPTPGLTALENDPIFRKSGIHLDIGRLKNIKKNLVAESALKELGLEFLHLYPEGGPVTKVSLALATATTDTVVCLPGKYGHNRIK